MTSKFIACACALLFSATPLHAQSAPDIVTAKDPETIRSAMQYAGYPVEIAKDEFEDPIIYTQMGGWNGSILFYGCDAETKDQCDSVQLRAWFDRETPMPAEKINEVTKTTRFLSMAIDDEGDPYVSWDIMMDDGIPASVFLKSLDKFGWALNDASDIIFADD